MDFELPEEQRLLKDSVERLLATPTASSRARYVRSRAAGAATLWKQFAELGLLGAAFAEELGGMGGGAIET